MGDGVEEEQHALLDFGLSYDKTKPWPRLYPQTDLDS